MSRLLTCPHGFSHLHPLLLKQSLTDCSTSVLLFASGQFFLINQWFILFVFMQISVVSLFPGHKSPAGCSSCDRQPVNQTTLNILIFQLELHVSLESCLFLLPGVNYYGGTEDTHRLVWTMWSDAFVHKQPKLVPIHLISIIKIINWVTNGSWIGGNTPGSEMVPWILSVC